MSDRITSVFRDCPALGGAFLFCTHLFPFEVLASFVRLPALISWVSAIATIKCKILTLHKPVMLVVVLAIGTYGFVCCD